MKVKAIRLILFVFYLLPALHSSSQTIHLSGRYVLRIPPDNEKLNLEILKWDSLAKKDVRQVFEKGKYIVQTRATTYYFETDENKDFIGDIIILGNHYGADSVMIKQERSNLKSVRRYWHNELLMEKIYLGDSIFSYKQIFNDGSYYIGKSRLNYYGERNVEHNEYDSLNRPVEKSFRIGDTLFEKKYKLGILKSEKRISREPEFLYYADGKLVKREVYRQEGDSYYRFVYDAKGKLIGSKEPVSRNEIFGTPAESVPIEQ